MLEGIVDANLNWVPDPDVDKSPAIIWRLLEHESKYAVQASCRPHFQRPIQRAAACTIFILLITAQSGRPAFLEEKMATIVRQSKAPP